MNIRSSYETRAMPRKWHDNLPSSRISLVIRQTEKDILPTTIATGGGLSKEKLINQK